MCEGCRITEKITGKTEELNLLYQLHDVDYRNGNSEKVAEHADRSIFLMKEIFSLKKKLIDFENGLSREYLN